MPHFIESGARAASVYAKRERPLRRSPSLFTIDQVADWEWIEGETRQVLHQKPGYPTYTATVAKYCDLMCALPGGIARLNGVAAPAVKPVLIANAESQPVPTKAISA